MWVVFAKCSLFKIVKNFNKNNPHNLATFLQIFKKFNVELYFSNFLQASGHPADSNKTNYFNGSSSAVKTAVHRFKAGIHQTF
jgi:hypothetical protein